LQQFFNGEQILLEGHGFASAREKPGWWWSSQLPPAALGAVLSADFFSQPPDLPTVPVAEQGK